MNRTNIEWVRNPDGSPGYTLNIITGCLNHDNGLCKGGGFPCYAYKLANGRLRPLYLANKIVAPITQYGNDVAEAIRVANQREAISFVPFYPRFWEERLSEPIEQPTPMRPAKRKGIFVCDMGDLFGIGIPEIWTEQVMTTIKLCPYHRFYLLTKQPQNLIKFSPFPENAWVGVTATNQEMLIDALAELHRIKATIKYISFEPLLEAMNGGECEGKRLDGLAEDIDWLIIGACTGTYPQMLELAYRYEGIKYPIERLTRFTEVKATFQPRIEWVREIVEAADKAGIPVFLKNNLAPLINWPDVGAWAFKKLSNMLRQEIPE